MKLSPEHMAQAVAWVRAHPILLCPCRQALLHLWVDDDGDITVQHGDNPEHSVGGEIGHDPGEALLFYIHGIAKKAGKVVSVVVGGTWLEDVHRREQAFLCSTPKPSD